MEITRIHIGGSEVNVIFTGEQYIFHNTFFGVIAVANRDYNPNPEYKNFSVDIDNYRTIGSKCNFHTIAKAVIRYITREENRNVETITYKINKGCKINEIYDFKFCADYKYNNK